MHYLFNLIDWMQNYSKAQPIMAGLIGLSITGMLTFVFIKVPVQIWKHIVHQLTTTLTLNNSTIGGNLENFNAFLKWYLSTPWVGLSRSFNYDPTWQQEDQIMGIGVGSHFFMFKGRFFWLSRSQRGQGTGYHAQISYEITITMLGRKQKVLWDLVDEFKYRAPSNKVGIYQIGAEGWNRISEAPMRPLKTVIVAEEIKKDLLEQITWFRANRDWYIDKGLPHKLIILFHGKSGSGKTSMIKALASYFNMNLCLLNLNEMHDRGLTTALTTAPDDSMIAIEDVDTSPATKGRRGLSVGEVKEKEDADKQIKTLKPLKALKPGAKLTNIEKGDVSSKLPDSETNQPAMGLFRDLTLGGILNSLDGLLPLDGTIIFMSTNQLDRLDSALVRDGRVDLSYAINELNDADIREYIRNVAFPDYTGPLADEYQPIMGATLYKLFSRNKRNAEKFIASIPQVVREEQNEHDTTVVGIPTLQAHAAGGAQNHSAAH
jgi:mitochondrial chaperone BCS1